MAQGPEFENDAAPDSRRREGTGSHWFGDGEANWVRLLGAFLIIAGISLGPSAIAWLVTADGSIESTSILALTTVVRGVVIVGGMAIVVQPSLLAALAGVSSVLLGVGGVLALVGVIAAIGSRVAPPTDNRLAWYPQFSCAPEDAFCNRTEAAGLRDVKRYGKGAAFVDLDNDGWVDLFAANSDPGLDDDPGVSSFYLNNGDGSFRAIDSGVREEDLVSNWAGAFADMDNDGDQDLLLLGGGYDGTGTIALYENRMAGDEGFVPVTADSGLDALNATASRWWGAAWADYNGDGYLDFAASRLYQPAVLFRNNRDGTFTDVTASLGVETTRAARRDGKNVVWFDYDNDGDPDLYLAGIESHNLFENLEGKYLLDVTERVFEGVFPPNRFFEKSAPVVFAAAAADFNQDGLEDLYLGRQSEQDLVLFNEGEGRFTAAGTEVGIDASLVPRNDKTRPFENTMGLGVGDLQDDGWPDVLIGSGDAVRADPDVFLCNDRGRFERCTELLRGNADGEFRTRTHGMVFGDVNQDGASDVFQNLGGHATWDDKSGIDSREHGALFVANPRSGHNTAAVTLEGTTSNRDAIGARVKAVADGTHYYTVRSAQGYQSQNDRTLVIALGTARTADLEIRWPSGTVSRVSVDAGDRVTVEEPPPDR